MREWHELRAEGLGPIQRVAAAFQVGPPPECLPFPSFKVKVLERANGSFLAIPNVAPLDPDGYPTREAGHGSTIEEALEDTLRRFTHLLNQLEPRTEADFAWSDPSEF